MLSLDSHFSKFAFVLFCYITSHLNISQGKVKGYIEILRKQNSLFSSVPVIKRQLLKISNRNPQAGSSLFIIGWYSYQKYIKVLLKQCTSSSQKYKSLAF